MRTSVLTPFLDIIPGRRAEVRVEVTNTLPIVDLITIEALDLLPGEATFDRSTVSLFPDEDAVVTMNLDLRPTFPAGAGLIAVRIASTLRPEMVEIRTIEVDVEPVAGAALAVSPGAVRARRKAEVVATVTNTGNTALNLSVDARDEERHLRFVVEPPSLLLAPGLESDVVIEGKGRPPFFGSPAYRTITVNASSEAGYLTDSVSFTQRPVIARGLLTALVLAAIVALWAIIVTIGVDFALGNDPAPKALPIDFAEPVSFADLASVGAAAAGGGPGAEAVAAVLGSAQGTVIGEASGEPIPRIAVEAHRVRRGQTRADLGGPGTRVQSAATGDDGTYMLDGLFPGEYYLLVSGAGFDDAWSPGVADAAAAEPVEIGAGGALDVAPLRVAGVPGTIVGAIDTGDQVTPVTIIVRPLVNDVPGPELTRIEVASPDADGDGNADGPITYELPNLLSPLAYSLTFASDQFADQSIVERLGAGQRLDAAPVRLVPGDGEVTGIVVLLGAPITGNLTVTATGNETDFVSEVPIVPTDVTAQTDPAPVSVSYRFEDLPTPGTYSLRFEAPGFEPTTSAVDLSAGDAVDAGSVTLTGGNRVLAGTVVDAVSGIRLGEVDVTVLGPEGASATKTLPAPLTPQVGDPAAADCRTPDPVPTDAAQTVVDGGGTFLLENLPLGIQSVTFSLDGYQERTIRVEVRGDAPVTVLGAAADDDGVYALVPTTGELCGRVLAIDGSPIPASGGGEVILRGGPAPGEPRPTPLASEPAGFFRLPGLTAGEYALTAEVPNFRSCTVLVEIGPGPVDDRRRVVTFRLPASTTDESIRCEATVGSAAP